MADAKREVIKLFRKIGDAKKAGLRSRYGVNQSEVYRMYGMIEWILELEETNILEQPEGWESVDPFQIKKGLKTAKERLNLAPVTEGLVKEVNMASGELSVFPKYLELPGPVVREKILSYLNPHDQLSVAGASISEVEYLPQPLSFLQFEAVFPIIYAKGLLDEGDLDNLKEVDPYFQSFVNKHLKDVNCKNTYPFGVLDYSEHSIPFEDFAELQNNGLIQHVSVSIVVDSDNYVNVMEQLRLTGERILDCNLAMWCPISQSVEGIASCLELMPNLEKLRITVEEGLSLELLPESDLVDMLPNLTCLRTLCYFDWEGSMSVLTRTLLQKYGPKLENLSVCPSTLLPEPATTLQLENLKTLNLSDMGETTFEEVLGYLNTFRDCRLQNLRIHFCTAPETPIIDANLRKLLAAVGTVCGQTLEVLSIPARIDFYRRILQYPQSHEGSPESTWMTSLEFPKLRSFELSGYPNGISWAFLLLFPQLQELAYYPVYYPRGDSDDPMGDEDKPFIEMYREKEKMMRNNMWKIFPRLDRIQFNLLGMFDEEATFMSLTRRECMTTSG